MQAAGGAKNFIVLMPDADVERTVEAVKDGAFGCAGERCMAGSTAVAVGEAGERLLPALAELVGAMKVGAIISGLGFPFDECETLARAGQLRELRI